MSRSLSMRNSEVSRQFFEKYHVVKAALAGEKPKTEEDKLIVDYLPLLLLTYKQWDPPKKVRGKYTDDVAEFILRGRFKQACENHEVPTDALMKELNIDVNDRFFTLLSRGII